MCRDWNSQLRRLIGAFGVEREAQLVFGMVKWFDVRDMQTRGRSPGHIHLEELQKVNRYLREMKNSVRAEFYRGIESDGDGLNSSEVEKEYHLFYHFRCLLMILLQPQQISVALHLE